MKLKLLELFGGIGACSKALERLGIDYEIADYVEIDKYAVKSYNAIHNTNFEPQDICKWDKDIKVDLIMHGSPCQDFSLAGKQAGGDKDSGTRSSLMYETIRIVEKLKPKYVIWENVKNLLSKKHRHNFDAYLETMESLGYTNYYQVLNAKDYGIPQNRERVFTVSIRDDGKKDESIDYLATHFKFPPKQELKLKLKYMLEDEVDEKYYLSDKAIHGRMITHYQKYKLEENCINNKEIHPTILARFEGAPTLYKENKVLLKEKLCNNLVENNLVKESDVIRHSYSTNRMNKMYTQNSRNNNISPTLDTRCDCLGVAVNQPPLRIRKLTPKECWRLMGFDDEDFEKAAKVNSNTQLYKQAGNSIVVNVLENIFKELFKEV